MNGVGPAAALTAAAVLIALALARRATPRFPLASAPAGGRRPRVAVVVCAAALVALAAATAALSARTARTEPELSAGARTMIVLDVSGSLSTGVYGPALARAVLFAARDAGKSAGLLIFAEHAVELLPPTSPATAVTRLARFVSVTSTAAGTRLSESTDAPRTYETPTPWSDAFIGNTDISSGLVLAERLLARAAGSAHRNRIVLISDLQDGGIGNTLKNTVRRAVRAGITIVAVPVGSTPADVAHWRSLGGRVEQPHPVPRAGTTGDSRASVRTTSLRLAACALAFAAVLGGLFLWASPLQVPRRATG